MIGCKPLLFINGHANAMRRTEPQPHRIRSQEKFDEASEEFRFYAERSIYLELLERAKRYEDLRNSLKFELKRFDRLSGLAKSGSGNAQMQETANAAIASATAALQDMPRAVTVLLLQNPLVYESIYRAGGMRDWMSLFATEEERSQPLPALLVLVDQVVRGLRDPLISS